MINLNQGNEYVLTFDIVNTDGTPKALTGSLNLKYQLSRSVYTVPVVTYELTDAELAITDAVNGTIQVTLPAATTKDLVAGRYYHEILQYDAVGVPKTLMSDNLRVKQKLIKE